VLRGGSTSALAPTLSSYALTPSIVLVPPTRAWPDWTSARSEEAKSTGWWLRPGCGPPPAETLTVLLCGS
jgi:hypothetical protein